MCGRYGVDENMIAELGRAIPGIGDGAEWLRGDICPSQIAWVLAGKRQFLTLERMRWGYPSYQGKGLVINARAESVLERRMFRGSVFHRRCVIPAGFFYEWDASKNKVEFQKAGAPVLYMAGFYQRFDDMDHFVILTTEANASVLPVHDRMPLLLERSELESWVYDDDFLYYALHKEQALLDRRQEYEQLSLF